MVKKFEHTTLELTNHNSIKVPKVLEPNNNWSYKQKITKYLIIFRFRTRGFFFQVKMYSEEGPQRLELPADQVIINDVGSEATL